jgi:hypothetical protein
LSRALALNGAPANDPKKQNLSRWALRLLPTNLPITKITCQTKTALFRRHVILYELKKDGVGETFTNILGEADWVKTPGISIREFNLPISNRPTSETLFLQIDNEDNAPIELENFQAFYPVSRIWFKTMDASSVALFYGNPNAGIPSYDLSLVANQLLASEKSMAHPGAEEPARTSRALVHALDGKGGIVFWSVLASVVIGLLAVISRLLPKPVSENK